MSEIATGATQIVWVKKETTQGVFEKPAASDAILVISDISGKQDRIFLEDEQKRLSLSRLGKIAGPYNPGEWSFTSYIKPSGSLGVEPAGDVLLEALFGNKSVSSGVNVEYSLYKVDDDIKTLSMIIKKGFETYFITGAFVDKGSFPIKAGDSNDAIFQASFSGKFLKSYLAGTDELSSAIDGTTTPVTSIPVVDAKKFEVGAYIIIGSDDNSGAGFKITAVDYSSNTITIDTGVSTAQSQGAVVKGWTPDVVESGYLVHGRFGVVQKSEDGSTYDDFVITEATIELTNNFNVLNDEKTGDSYPATITKTSVRDVDISITRYFYPEESRRRYDANNQTRFWIKIPVGDTAGKRARFEFVNVQFDSPEVSGEAEMNVSLKGKAYATTSLDDELKLIFD